MAERVTIVENVEVGQGTEREVTISWISEDWVGFDVSSKLSLFEDKDKAKNSREPSEKTVKLVKTRSGGKLGKAIKKRTVLLQQPMDKYFKTVKPMKRKRSSENNLGTAATKGDRSNEDEVGTEKNATSDPIEEEPKSSCQEAKKVDDDIVEATQTVKVDDENKPEEMGKKILSNCIATYLRCLNKRILSENLNGENLNSAMDEISSEVEPGLKSKTETVLKSIETNQNCTKTSNINLPSIQRHVAKNIKPLTRLKREMVAKRKDFLSSTRTLEFEASLPTSPLKLEQFSKGEKKRLIPERQESQNPKIENKTISWKSPLVEAADQKHFPHIATQSKPQQELISRKFQPTLKGKIPPYSLSDKDWAFNVQKCEEVVCKSFMDLLFGEDRKLSKLPETDLNATTSSTASMPKSAKTAVAKSVSTYTREGSDIMADKIRSAVPKINDEVKEERKETRAENKGEVEEEKEEKNKNVDEEPPTSQHSWEKDFLSNDLEEFFTKKAFVSEDNEENLKYKKFKELEDVIIRQTEFPVDHNCDRRYRGPVKKTVKQKKFLFGNEERLSPSACAGFFELDQRRNRESEVGNKEFPADNYGLHKNQMSYDLGNGDIRAAVPKRDFSKDVEEFPLSKSTFPLMSKRNVNVHQQPKRNYTKNSAYEPFNHYSEENIFDYSRRRSSFDSNQSVQIQNHEDMYHPLQCDYNFPRKPPMEHPRDFVRNEDVPNHLSYFPYQCDQPNQTLPHTSRYYQNMVSVESQHDRPYIPQLRQMRYQDSYRPFPPIRYDNNGYFDENPHHQRQPRYRMPHYNDHFNYQQRHQPTHYGYPPSNMSEHPSRFTNRPIQKSRISPFETTYRNHDDLDFVLSFDAEEEYRHNRRGSFLEENEQRQERAQYNTDEREYLMEKFLKSQPGRSVDFNHTVSSNVMDTYEGTNFLDFK